MTVVRIVWLAWPLALQVLVLADLKATHEHCYWSALASVCEKQVFRPCCISTFHCLTFQVLSTLNTLKNKQKASLEEGKCAFMDSVMVVRERGRQPFYKSHEVISWAHHCLAFRFRFLYCSVWSYWVTEFRWCTCATVDSWALDKLCSNNNKINKEKKTPQFVL